jgi:hypothetical protein
MADSFSEFAPGLLRPALPFQSRVVRGSPHDFPCLALGAMKRASQSVVHAGIHGSPFERRVKGLAAPDQVVAASAAQQEDGDDDDENERHVNSPLSRPSLSVK